MKKIWGILVKDIAEGDEPSFLFYTVLCFFSGMGGIFFIKKVPSEEATMYLLMCIFTVLFGGYASIRTITKKKTNYNTPKEVTDREVFEKLFKVKHRYTEEELR